jgi:hypothetical protein
MFQVDFDSYFSEPVAVAEAVAVAAGSEGYDVDEYWEKNGPGVMQDFFVEGKYWCYLGRVRKMKSFTK